MEIPHMADMRDITSNLAATALIFASISFGACLTGAVVALTVPSEKAREDWASRGLTNGSFSHFSDLMFVFTWSAICQLGVVGAAIGLYLSEAPLSPATPEHVYLALPIFLEILGIVGVIAFAQLIAVVSTISQIAVAVSARR
ncbi:hypothetical protein [Acidithrix sp. C25]|uniref:hypothetical protein n=1 Tax=Acidithrix sp. C25 TaxID=1671482 RepID=UPI00191B98A3|nr:hypothetical protein [Acidithrix sp. C25]